MQGGNKKMDQFIQYTPTEVVFGKETENQAGAEVKKWGGTKVLVVYGGGSAKRSGLLDRVEASLAKEGLAFEELGGVKPNPRLALAEEGVKKAVEMQADFILAVGGGSSIDTAKAVAHGAANPEEALWDIWTKKVPLTKSLPVGAVLTIPAAGSEMSDSAVLTNEAIGKKAGINTPFNRCKFAIMIRSWRNPAEIPDCLRSNRHHDAHDGALFHSGEPVRDDGRDCRGTPPYRNQKRTEGSGKPIRLQCDGGNHVVRKPVTQWTDGVRTRQRFFGT